MNGPATATRDIRRLFVANRGEIAVRIIRACHKLGIEAVVGISEADVDSLPARMADEAVLIGPAPVSESYLRADTLIAAARELECQALHPGYGFLSESAEFAQACADAGVQFVGPSPDAIRSMGDKITAVLLASEAGVPRVPGSGSLSGTDDARPIALDIGYPVLIKATAGGGGRGMRVVRDESHLSDALRSASREAQAAFGNPDVYLEKFIERARHIEIQLIADEYGTTVHLGERECSTQRRHQKLIEEAPSPSIDAATRASMSEAAVQLAKHVGYVGAGTVEFIVDERDGRFYFIEMNTRIQVEHGVTEMVTGLDLVAEQIRIACGLPLSFQQDDVALVGHAIECRINAEDPSRNFRPNPGLISVWDLPQGNGIRVDSHCYAGYEVPAYYDSMIGKLLVHGDDRAGAIAAMADALRRVRIEGISTTVPFHALVLDSQDFIDGRVTTRWVEETFLPGTALGALTEPGDRSVARP